MAQPSPRHFVFWADHFLREPNFSLIRLSVDGHEESPWRVTLAQQKYDFVHLPDQESTFSASDLLEADSMVRISSIVLVVLFAAPLCLAQAEPQSSLQAATTTIGHGSFPVKVTKTLDSSKLKEGDTVELETSGGFKLPDGTLVPKGSKIFGLVTAAKARSKGDSQSQLVIAFDKLNVANGKQLAVKGTVQAVFPPADEPDPGVPGSSSHQGGPGSVPAPDYKPTTDIKTGIATETTSRVPPASDPKSTGVHGFDNLQLEDGVLSSKGKNVKLGNGVQLIVRVDILQ
jgi:hypothetical protein